MSFIVAPPTTKNHNDNRITEAYNRLQLKGELPLPSWRPLINRVLVLVDPESEISKGGIIVPDTARERGELGTVVQVGSGRISDHGVTIPCQVNIGDRVQFSKHSGTYVYDDELDLMLLLMIDTDAVVAKPLKKFKSVFADDYNPKLIAEEGPIGA